MRVSEVELTHAIDPECTRRSTGSRVRKLDKVRRRSGRDVLMSGRSMVMIRLSQQRRAEEGGRGECLCAQRATCTGNRHRWSNLKDHIRSKGVSDSSRLVGSELVASFMLDVPKAIARAERESGSWLKRTDDDGGDKEVMESGNRNETFSKMFLEDARARARLAATVSRKAGDMGDTGEGRGAGSSGSPDDALGDVALSFSTIPRVGDPNSSSLPLKEAIKSRGR